MIPDTMELTLILKYHFKKNNLAGAMSLNRINLEKPYDYSRQIEPAVMGAVDLGDGMIFSAGFRESEGKQGRWFFKQDIAIVKGADLELGYMNNPNILRWGLDLSWKSLRLSFSYLAISRLNDTMVIGLSRGE